MRDRKPYRALTIHPNMRAALHDALDRTLNQGYHASKVVEYNLKNNKKWGSRDRRLFAETLYDVVRWRPRLAWAAQVQEDQITLLLTAWLELNSGSPDTELQDRWDNAPDLQTAEAMPDWLHSRGEAEFGEQWGEVAAGLNTQAPLFLRANSLRGTLDQCVAALKDEEVITRTRGGSVVEVVKRQNVFTTKAFKEGWFEVQDMGSQDIGPFLQVEPGMRVIDACAGGGGKALHLAAMMENKGSLIAMDVHQWKLEELKKRARRAGVHCIQTRLIEGSKTIKRMQGTADRLLLDVPCSGAGVLRRKPDTKWKVDEAGLADTRKLQAEIVSSYARMVKPGGIMVYATCSILREENGAQVEKFLESHQGWSLETEETRLPEPGGSDGFYMARLRLAG